ncbi:hypothetical protein SAMN03159353_1005193 [Cedecea sp. NFIX57]|nr:hypothetical protein SAMN03159353_1005193 [Cedecea sp. NFIX57]
MSTILIILAVGVVLGVLYVCFVPTGKSPITGLWSTLPTKQEYLQAHPAEVSPTGSPQCFHCHSSETLDVGLARFTDFRRTIICSKCKNQLWREQD